MIPIDNTTLTSNISKSIGVPIDQIYTTFIVFLGIPLYNKLFNIISKNKNNIFINNRINNVIFNR